MIALLGKARYGVPTVVARVNDPAHAWLFHAAGSTSSPRVRIWSPSSCKKRWRRAISSRCCAFEVKASP
jgi:hypothetical protein